MTESPPEEARALLAFWFEELTPAQWFAVDPKVDALLAQRFGDLPERGRGATLDAWQSSAAGALALVLVLDQLPRNLFRGTPRAFAFDETARRVARSAIARGQDHALGLHQRAFLYLPFEHSEALADQEWAVALFDALGEPTYADYARRHHEVIRRFGRFPHRNAILGRTSTAEEAAYLAEPGSGF